MFGLMDWHESPAPLRMLEFEATRELVFQLTVLTIPRPTEYL